RTAPRTHLRGFQQVSSGTPAETNRTAHHTGSALVLTLPLHLTLVARQYNRTLTLKSSKRRRDYAQSIALCDLPVCRPPKTDRAKRALLKPNGRSWRLPACRTNSRRPLREQPARQRIVFLR